jgi:hypothetical protein
VSQLKFLIDTNILIPLEPTSHEELKEDSDDVRRFAQLSQSCGTSLYIHPCQKIDIGNDTNLNRGAALLKLTDKYPLLDPPPHLTSELKNLIGVSELNTNDWVDDNLLAAVFQKAVQFLVTQDKEIHKKAKRAGLENSVLDVSEAIEYLSAGLTQSTEPTPAVRLDKAYNLNPEAQIFSSLHEDYPGFGDWLDKCANQGRDVFLIDAQKEREYAGLVILNPENSPPNALEGKVLKLCTFKVGDKHVGSKFGELLLKNIFNYAMENSFDWIFVEVFPKHELLIVLLETFGFEDLKCHKSNGERIFAKPIMATDSSISTKDAFEFHRRHGPHRVTFNGINTYAVPIQPQFDELLFPERQKQINMFQGTTPFGNSIRKAYLCNASIRRLQKGDLLLFYRSGDEKAASALGIVEDTLVSQSVEDIIAFVGKVTVYGEEDIKSLCQKETLAVLFRQVKVLNEGIPLSTLLEAGVLNGAPQSIGLVSNESVKWLKQKLEI